MNTILLIFIAIFQFLTVYFLYLIVKPKLKQLKIFRLFKKKEKGNNTPEFGPDGHVIFDKKGKV